MLGAKKYHIRFSCDIIKLEAVRLEKNSFLMSLHFGDDKGLVFLAYNKLELIKDLLESKCIRTGSNPKIQVSTFAKYFINAKTDIQTHIEEAEFFTFETIRERIKKDQEVSDSSPVLPTLDDFQILKLLGYGGFSKVYLVLKKSTQELFALKCAKLDEMRIKKRRSIYKNQIKMERDILAELHHPFLMELKCSFQINREFFFLMPYIQGGELLQYITIEKNPIDRERMYESDITNRVKFYAAQIVLALNYLHDNEIIYSDLKPQNILIDKYGYIKLTDFGASRNLLGKTRARGFACTPDYVAPESYLSQHISKSTDWWTFGVLLYFYF